MQPLVDADVLVYECGFAAETGWGKDKGAPPFEYAAEFLDNRIKYLCSGGGNTSPLLFLTGKTNFRTKIAKRQKYKDRPSNKPYHYKNLIAYIKGKYDYRITEGLEADDLICIEQTQRPEETIICTRDKDLRACGGWHYGWELGNQPQFGPERVEGLGRITLSRDRKSIKGVGLLFFYSQLLTGDKVDSIPGCEGIGPVKAYETLKNCTTSKKP
jgi:5'-3' exonuclease